MDNNSFFSLDRLVEFGLGMGIANQMINVMNRSMKEMYIPGSVHSIPNIPPQIYYVAIEGKPIGPLNDADLSRLIEQNKLTEDTLYWMPGMNGWEAIERVPAILKLVALMPPSLNL